MEKLITAPEIAEKFRVSEPLIYRWAREGRINHIRVSCPGVGQQKKQYVVRFKEEDVEKKERRQEQEAEREFFRDIELAFAENTFPIVPRTYDTSNKKK